MGKSVLILDDDIDFNHLLTDIFKQADYEVTSERDPETAIQAFQERPYSLVVTDQKMPGLTGEEFIREIKKLRPGTPVIMVSGYLDNDTIRALIRDGVGGVFLKPLNVFSLLKRTAALIDKTEKTERAAVGGSEESEFTSFQHDLPYAFSAYACKAPKSTAFAEKLFGLRNFKSNLLIIGPEGIDVAAIARDMEGFEPDAADAYILLDSHRLDEAAIHQQLLNAEAAGAKRLTVVAPHQRLLEGANREVIFDIARCKDTFADLQSNSVRCLFFLTEDVDSLYDRGFFDDEVYMFLGTSEIKAPKLADVRDDVPLLARRYLQESAAELQIEPAAVPRLNASAGVFLRDRDWLRNHIELKRFMARTLGAVECAGQLLSREELAAVEQQMEAAAPSGSIPDIRARLTRERDEYVKAVYVLSGRDSGKAAIMLGVEPALVDAIVNAA